MALPSLLLIGNPVLLQEISEHPGSRGGILHAGLRLGITANIRQQEIETWKDDPQGKLTVVEFSPLAGPRSYGLELFYPSGYVE